MRILAIDMGTGTQDILVFDSDRPVENCVKMVMPSATEIAARRIRAATTRGERLLLTGSTAGGGPCAWALEDHIRSGGTALATPSAAATFDDDLDRVRDMGIELISEDEAATARGTPVRLGDLDLDAIGTALRAFEESAAFDGFALGCLDHGAAPPGVSDRLFRFDHLRRQVERRNDLLAFACAAEDLPPYLTRARAMVTGVDRLAPTVFMDTGPAAALGALHDPAVNADEEQVVLNLGNMHLLGFYLRGRRIASLFEHHTGEVSDDQIASMTERLATGELTHAEVFDTKGHGALHADRGLVRGAGVSMVAATGPRRGRLEGSRLAPYFAAPFGDMMIGGCFGLVRGFADLQPQAAEAVAARLGPLPG